MGEDIEEFEERTEIRDSKWFKGKDVFIMSEDSRSVGQLEVSEGHQQDKGKGQLGEGVAVVIDAEQP